MDDMQEQQAEQTLSKDEAGKPKTPKNRALILERTIYTQKQLEPIETVQIALAGRSNVGKSSLINCLAGRKSLAKISSTPGKTQSLNFYRVEPGDYYLVDLPGYGYAKRSKSEREAWAKLIERYLSGADRLKAVAVLLDCRLPPQSLDVELASWVRERGARLVGVLTKADKCKQSEQAARRAQWAELLSEPPLLFSSKTGFGRDRLWSLFDSIAQDE